MKKVIFLALFMPSLAFGQILENFETGTLINWVESTEGRWKADPEGAISEKFSLHHTFDNPDAGIDRIGLPVRNFHPSEGSATWTFKVRHGYDPSSSNNWSVFLMSDTDPSAISAEGATNGYAIGVNLTGYDDTLRLVKVKGTTISTVVNCRINWQTSVGITETAKIIVERSQDGNWTVSALRNDGTSIGAGSGKDIELFSPAWFAIYYKYSSTRDRLLWIDDISIEGIFYEDNDPPYVTGCSVSGKRSVDVTFSELPVDKGLLPENFSLNSKENISVKVTRRSALTYNIEFSNALINKSLNTLIINEICDNAGNCSSGIMTRFTPVWAETGDIVISEIMADPLPEVSLPGREYLEITNRTGFSYNLKGWNLSAGDQKYPFDETIIQPGEIIIICLSADVTLFAKYGKVTGLRQFPSLTDGGRVICLLDSTGSLIHGVEYSSKWYGDELKSGGGWSLEIVDSEFPFFAEGNWRASSSRLGGTPGTANSVAGKNPDNSFYGIQNVFPLDNSSVVISFSEPVFSLTSILSNITIGGNSIIGIYPVDMLNRKYKAIFGNAYPSGKIYGLEISSSITDFAGNKMERKEFVFGLPEPAEQGDLLFNELLFNPFPGDADYIELYNRSSKIIDASRLQLVSVSDASGDTSQIFPVWFEGRCIMPDSYFTVTTARERVIERYFSSDPEFIFESGSLPSMNDDKGHLILFNRELDKIDEVIYDKNMHFTLLSSFDGVALEKTNPQLRSEEAVNWHSAAESAGWGTPGAQNSLFIETPSTSDKISFSSSKITPDGDGFEDFLVINFDLKGNGNVISATVYDETGTFVKKIASNILAAPESTLIWDGTAEDGTPLRTGIYIIFISLYDDTGKTDKWKKVCTVIRK